MDALLEGFERLCRDRAGDLAVDSRAEGRALSFEQLSERSRAWGRALGDDPRPVALAAGNRTAFVELFIALRSLGVTVVAMDDSGTADERLTLCRRLGIPRLIQGEMDGEMGAGSEVRDLGDGLGHFSTGAETVEPPPGTALVKLTSGSTGAPLAACFSADALDAGIRQIVEGMEIAAHDRVLMVLPLSHSYGFDNGVLSLLFAGTALVIERSVFPADVLRAVKRTGASFLPLVPPLVRSLANAPWPASSSLRRVICAGGVLPPEFARRFRRSTGLAVHNFYGSTETGGICFERTPECPGADGTVGQPLPGVRLFFDAEGRVHVDSRANLLGYLTGGDAAGDPGRQVRTGDLGELTPEGRLRLTGRSADLLNIGGRKIAAAQVESALRGLEGISDAAVVGAPDAMRGDRAVAFVVARDWPVSLDTLPSRLRPREVRRLEALPHNERGKLDRRQLRSWATDPGSAGNRPASATEQGPSEGVE